MSHQVSDQQLLEVASQLAHDAGGIIRSFQGKTIKKEKKSDHSPVTEADLQSDQLIREGLEKAFPEIGILTEETGFQSGTQEGLLWVVDPLDGTKAFVRGIPGYCVMIGLLKDQEPYLGVVVDPLDDHAYQAIRGQGAFHIHEGKRERVQVSSRSQFKEMPLIISTGFPEKKLEKALNLLGSPLVEPINSVGIKVGWMTRQIGDIYLNHHGVHYWDTCAPKIILEEAGGVFTHLDGAPLVYDLSKGFSHDTPTLASNGTRHSDLVEICQPLMI